MAASEFAWGTKDCALVIADWWAVNHGADPASHLRETYGSRDECHAVLNREGGLCRLVSRLARSVGAVRSSGDSAGDFGVIRHGDRHLAAIRTQSGRWAVKGEKCVTALKNPKVVAAWHV
ncbi:DUF6950 family protein [Rhizobium sp. PP-CC-3G-465]|uniref:DUF6950 family protein n=1 Tax=Rhizobium sp. PP-CC-3G-465 TaxID=2135648 RepID=UPI003BAB520B